MSSSGQISVNIALQGADSFNSSIDSVSSKLQSLQTAAGTAGTGVNGLGTNAQGATTGVNSLGDGSASTTTKVLAAGGAISAASGFAVTAVGSYEGLARSNTALERANVIVEKATQAHEKALDALNKMTDTGTGTQGKYQKAVESVAKAEETVQKDKEALQKAEENYVKTLEKYGPASDKTKAAYQKVQDAGNKLKDDTGKLSDAQGKVTTAQEATTTQSPKLIEAQQKVQSTADALKVALEKQKEQADATKLAHIQFYQTLLGQGLSAIGTIINSIGLLTRGVSGTSGAMNEAKTAAGALGGAGGIGIGGPLMIGLGILAVVLIAIATNFGGIRDAINTFAAQLVAANPWLKPFVDLIGALADNLGLTGKGFMQNTGAIPKAIKEIYDQIVQTPIGQAFADISTAIQNFFKDPFGSTQLASQGATGLKAYNRNFPYIKDNAYLQGAIPGIQDIQQSPFAPTGNYGGFQTSPGVGQMTSNTDVMGQAATNLGKALLEAMKKAFEYVITNLPKAIKAVGDAITSEFGKLMPSMDTLGGNIVDGLANYFSGKSAATAKGGGPTDKVSKAFWDMVYNAITGASAGDAAQRAIGGFVDQLIIGLGKGMQNSKTKTALTDSLMFFLFGDLGKDVQKIFGPLFVLQNWAGLVKNAQDALISVFAFTGKSVGTAVNTIFGPLFDINNWKSLNDKANAAIDAALKIAAKDVTAIISPLFDVNNWKDLNTKANTAIDAALKIVAKDVTDIISPLFDVNNWKTLNTQANTAINAALKIAAKDVTGIISALFDVNNWKTLNDSANKAIDAALKLAAKDVDGIIGALFDVNNWTKLNTQANTAINAALKLAQKDFDNILGILGSASAWQSLGTKIGDALKTALITGVNTAIQAINAAIGMIPGHPQIPLIPTGGQGGTGQVTQGPVQQSQPQPQGSPSGAGTGANPFAGTQFRALYAPGAAVNTAQPINVLVTIDGKAVMTSLKPYQLSGSGALT